MTKHLNQQSTACPFLEDTQRIILSSPLCTGMLVSYVDYGEISIEMFHVKQKFPL